MVRIRVANQSDKAIIKSVTQEFFDNRLDQYNPFDEESFERILDRFFLNKEKAYTMIATLDEKPIGMAVVDISPSEEQAAFKHNTFDFSRHFTSADARIYKVRALCQRVGIGTALMREIVNLAGNGGFGKKIETMALWFRGDNEGARKLYQYHNFEKKMYIFAPKEDAQAVLQQQDLSPLYRYSNDGGIAAINLDERAFERFQARGFLNHSRQNNLNYADVCELEQNLPGKVWVLSRWINPSVPTRG